MTARILFAGGGTGGHVFPLVALAEAFEFLAPSIDRVFVGTAKGLEAKVIPARGWKLETLPVEPLKGRSILGAVRGGIVATAAFARAASLVRRLRPSLVVSIGGYAAGPVALAAATLGCKLALLEPDRETGLTQRLLGPFARRIYLGFPESIATVGDKKGRAFGTPLRRGFSPADYRRRTEGDPLRVLIVGGSQGAEFLNHTLPTAIAQLAGDTRVSVVHQGGRGRRDDIEKRYRRAFDVEQARMDQKNTNEDDLERRRRKGERPLPVEVLDFIEDMPSRIAHADVVVARAGAITCAELCAVGRPAILIPLPLADGHQRKNAETLVAAGAAKLLAQEDATVERLQTELRALAREHESLEKMASNARLRGRPDAAFDIANDMIAFANLEVAKKPTNGQSAARTA